jgi:hypothetical protein
VELSANLVGLAEQGLQVGVDLRWGAKAEGVEDVAGGVDLDLADVGGGGAAG